MQGLVGTFLEQSLGMFISQQRQLRDRVRSLVGVDALGPITAIAEKNVSQLMALQERLLPGRQGARREATTKRTSARGDPADGTPARR